MGGWDEMGWEGTLSRRNLRPEKVLEGAINSKIQPSSGHSVVWASA